MMRERPFAPLSPAPVRLGLYVAERAAWTWLFVGALASAMLAATSAAAVSAPPDQAVRAAIVGGLTGGAAALLVRLMLDGSGSVGARTRGLITDRERLSFAMGVALTMAILLGVMEPALLGPLVALLVWLIAVDPARIGVAHAGSFAFVGMLGVACGAISDGADPNVAVVTLMTMVAALSALAGAALSMAPGRVAPLRGGWLAVLAIAALLCSAIAVIAGGGWLWTIPPLAITGFATALAGVAAGRPGGAVRARRYALGFVALAVAAVATCIA